jgi:hypothetical protein
MDNEASAYLSKRRVPTIGYVPPKKLAGTYRWLFGNINGLSTNRAQNFKADRLRSLISEYEPDGLGFVEIGLDVRHLKPSETIATILQLDGTTRTATSTNRHQPKLGKRLQGGCAIIALGEICQYVKITNGSNDPRDLGRICSMILQANPQHRTRIVNVYNVGRPKTHHLGSVYQQHLRYIQEEDLDTNPRALMRSDLLDLLKTWLQQGDRILLHMDANENVLTGPLCSRLAELGFTPCAHSLHGHIPNTHVSGTECIDEVWSSFGLEVTGVQVQSYHNSVGDHRSFLVDFTTRSAIGLYAHLIVRPDCRRLVNSNKRCADRYRQLVEEQWKRHRIMERLEALEALEVEYPVSPEHERKLAVLDNQIREIATYGEANCRKITKIDGEFSLATKYWHEKAVALKALGRRLDHKTHNDGNICRTARRHGIPKPRRLTRTEIKHQY